MMENDIYTIAFYNLENLFDIKNDPTTLDDDFTPRGKKNWNKKRYDKKCYKLARAISNVGKDIAEKPPVLVGVAEVENKEVLLDLIKNKHLEKHDFGVVHHDSPDERGIDTGLLYQKRYFKVLASEAIPLLLYDEDGVRDFTRDILYVKGELNQEQVHVFVNHWPSRRDGSEETTAKRIEAAKVLKSKLKEILEEEEDPAFIIMGDFNADPHSKSIKELMFDRLYNPMEQLLSPRRGSANYKFKWSLFDQIIVSHNFFDYKKGTHGFNHANIFDKKFLKEWKGKYKGNPFRTYKGSKYLGGYSDHFPVYMHLKLHK